MSVTWTQINRSMSGSPWAVYTLLHAGWGKRAVCQGNVQEQKIRETEGWEGHGMVFSQIRELNRLPQLKQDKERAGA